MQNVFSASISFLPKHFMKLPLHLRKILFGHEYTDGTRCLTNMGYVQVTAGGQDSMVNTVACFGLDGPGMKSSGGKIFCAIQTSP
jgi:hypothetical protein